MVGSRATIAVIRDEATLYATPPFELLTFCRIAVKNLFYQERLKQFKGLANEFRVRRFRSKRTANGDVRARLIRGSQSKLLSKR